MPTGTASSPIFNNLRLALGARIGLLVAAAPYDAAAKVLASLNAKPLLSVLDFWLVHLAFVVHDTLGPMNITKQRLQWVVENRPCRPIVPGWKQELDYAY